MKAGAKLIVIGGANLDIKGYAEGDFQFGSSNSGMVSESAGGVGRNIAAALAQLGGDVSLLSAVGEDKTGEIVLAETGKTGVNLEYIKRVREKKTGVYLAVLDNSGELVGAINAMDIIVEINSEYLDRCSSVLTEADWIFIDTNLTNSAIKWLLEADLRAQIMVDPVSLEKAEKVKDRLEDIDFITPNLIEFAYLFSYSREKLNKLITADNFDGLIEIVARQRRNFSPNTEVIVTLGKKGAIYVGQTEAFWQEPPSFQGPVLETTGAGDALTAGLLYGLSQRWPARASLQLGQKIAALTVTYQETVIPDLSNFNLT